MPLAIQEDMLPGRNSAERFAIAQRLGFDGVMFWADNLGERISDINAQLKAHNLQAAAVHLGRHDGYLSPHLHEREAAIGRMRQAIADAVDLGASHVIFVPHYGGPRLPDLTPYRAPIELEAEMMIWLLRTVSDLAYAFGVTLLMQPVNRYESYFMNRLEQASLFRKKIKDHEYVKIAANLFHMILEEANPYTALRDHAKNIAHILIADTNRRLPGQGLFDFGALGACLGDMEYQGWLTLEVGNPSENQAYANRLYYELPESLALLRRCGVR